MLLSDILTKNDYCVSDNGIWDYEHQNRRILYANNHVLTEFDRVVPDLENPKTIVFYVPLDQDIISTISAYFELNDHSILFKKYIRDIIRFYNKNVLLKIDTIKDKEINVYFNIITNMYIKHSKYINISKKDMHSLNKNGEKHIPILLYKHTYELKRNKKNGVFNPWFEK